jgi:hypothetical protein
MGQWDNGTMGQWELESKMKNSSTVLLLGLICSLMSSHYAHAGYELISSDDVVLSDKTVSNILLLNGKLYARESTQSLFVKNDSFPENELRISSDKSVSILNIEIAVFGGDLVLTGGTNVNVLGSLYSGREIKMEARTGRLDFDGNFRAPSIDVYGHTGVFNVGRPGWDYTPIKINGLTVRKYEEFISSKK